ncbi:ABC transporter substrate-binding protein [Ancylobacter terrae]|uniref:ABC transporter substrate-binding protein n=1 Tax=Ancylobacter sp. sgz301288 TaxID=3342077 RepID=UPI00385CA1D9
MLKLKALAFLSFLGLSFAAQADVPESARQAPSLAAAVKAGTLPPLAERLPQQPRVIDVRAAGGEPGQYGGTWRMLMGDQRDIRMVTIYGYTRLMVFNLKGELVPDILERVDVEEGRIFTLKLREGHRWSDGHPFTSEDFRYWWDDIANNERLSPSGLPPQLMVDGKPPKMEVVDPTTVRFSWDAPNPGFLPAIAATQPLEIMMPAHYLKQFHKRYADPDQLAKLVKEAKVKDWGALHDRRARAYRPENPDLPTLGPWRPMTKPPAELFVFERNPYFHRVDEDGRQLPYIDRLTLSIGTSSLVPAKVGAGGSDLQARYLRFDNYTFLKAAEQRQNYTVRLWERGEGAYVSIVPNLNAADPGWRAVLRDVRVRRALSVGLNRHDINQVIFFGLAHEGANTVIPGSPLYKSEYDTAWAQYDPALANRLLDEAGLSKRDHDGIRLLPDGRRMEITVETAGESTEETDILELVAFDWRKIGVALYPRATQTGILRRGVAAGTVMMSVAMGLDNATPGPDMDPGQLAPMNSMQFQWPMWGQYVDSGGREGEAPGTPEAAALTKLHEQWRRSTTTEERADIWRQMLEINADQVFTIGIINRTAQPVVVSNHLHNVPPVGIYSYEPGAYFGIYNPDTFWFDNAGQGN